MFSEPTCFALIQHYHRNCNAVPIYCGSWHIRSIPHSQISKQPKWKTRALLTMCIEYLNFAMRIHGLSTFHLIRQKECFNFVSVRRLQKTCAFAGKCISIESKENCTGWLIAQPWIGRICSVNFCAHFLIAPCVSWHRFLSSYQILCCGEKKTKQIHKIIIINKYMIMFHSFVAYSRVSLKIDA